MIRIAFIACAVFAVASADEEASNFLEKLQICNARDNACLKEAIRKATPLFMKGIPEIGLKPIDPFPTEYEALDYNFGAIRAKTVLKDVYTYGVSKHEILAVRSTPTDGRHHLEVDVHFPRILVEGNYKFEGELGPEIKLGGKGLFNVSMEGITATWNMDGRVEDDRWIVEHFVMLPEVEEMKVYFDDLFNGNEILNNAAKGFINEYWRLFYRSMLPITAKAWDKQITDYLNTIFSKISYRDIFL